MKASLLWPVLCDQIRFWHGTLFKAGQFIIIEVLMLED